MKHTALLLFALGATLGLFLDWLHVVSETTAYADRGLWGQPWWVPLLFGSAGVALGLGRVVTGRLLGEPARAVTRGEAAIALGVFVLAYAESAFLPDVLAIVGLALTSLVLVLWLDRSRAGLAAALGAALLGPLTEVVLTSAGQFRYVSPQHFVLGVPVWLPLLYVCASVAVGAVARASVDPLAAGTETRQ